MKPITAILNFTMSEQQQLLDIARINRYKDQTPPEQQSVNGAIEFAIYIIVQDQLKTLRRYHKTKL